MTVRSEELKDRAPAAEGKPATEHRNGHTPLRGKRPALWMLLALTAMFAPLAVTPWYFNGQLSVDALAIVYTTVIGHAPPAAVALIFQRGGWGLVIRTTVAELLAFFLGLSRRRVPGIITRAAVVFGTYDLISTGIGLYGRWQPEGWAWWGAWLIASIAITYRVEFVLTLFWKEW